MSDRADITIVQDTATPKLEAVARYYGSRAAVRYVGRAALAMTRAHLENLSPNKMGWPSTGFYQGAARGTTLSVDRTEVRILIDNHEHPGAMKHQYNRGQEGTTFVFAGDKLLTVPARAEFYGHRASEFTNLRFVQFGPGGAKALVIGDEGSSRVNFSRGTESNKGIGVRSRGMVAYWLKDVVEQEAKPEVLPSPAQYALAVKEAANDAFDQIVHQGGQG